MTKSEDRIRGRNQMAESEGGGLSSSSPSAVIAHNFENTF